MTALAVNALYPSGGLYPGPSLYPQGPVYTGGPVAPHKVAMAVGTGGALVDVSGFVEFGEGVGYTWGRQAQWDDTPPGTFTFTLNNSDGRFTPDNPTSPLATKVAEGTAVVWQLGTRLVQTAVLSVEFGTDEESYDLLKVTCDDQLGAAGRHQLTNLADGLLGNSPARMALAWKLDESEGPTSAEVTGSTLGPLQATRTGAFSTGIVTYGVQQPAWLPGTAVTVTAQPGETVYYGTRSRTNTVIPTPPMAYGWPATLKTDGTQYELGFWNFWAYPGSTINLAVTYKFATVGGRWPIVLQVTPTGLAVTAGTYPTTSVHQWTAAELQSPQWVSLYVSRYYSGQWWVTTQVLVNDVSVGGSVPYNDPKANDARTWDLTSDPQPVQVEFQVVNTGSAPLSGTVQRLSYTLGGTGNEKNAVFNVLDQRRAVLDFISDELSSATYPGTTLSTTPIGYPDVSGRSVLDVYNDIQRTEQGHLFVTTTGTLTNATAQIQIRARDRPATVKAKFDVTAELSGLPTFLRDITNLANRVDVQGATQTVTVTDPTVTVTSRYLAANLSETVLNSDPGDLRLWGQDRLLRGKTANVRAESFTIDLYTTPTDRSGDVLALVPGDRVQLTNLPPARFGTGTWDGWVLGLTESHAVDSHQVTVYLQPCLASPIVLDTGLVANGGELTLTAALTATATSMTVAGGGDLLSSTVPYLLQLDSEHVQVTAVDSTGLTATIVRGLDGTTAATHTAGTAVEVLTPATLGF